MRHGEPARLVLRSLAVSYAPGTVLDAHRHDWAQLVYASAGVMSVHTREGTWVVPSNRAVWIPAGIVHSVAMSGRVSMRTLYLLPELVEQLPRRCCVVAVPALLRELILHAAGRGPLAEDRVEHRRLVGFLVDMLREQLVELRAATLEVRMPRDERAVRLALRLLDAPGERASLESLARSAGGSRRTLERLFQRETGLSLGRWRQQARLLEALRLLARGEQVTAVALEVGYENPSAFIAMFSAALGTTPGRYYRSRPALASGEAETA